MKKIIILLIALSFILVNSCRTMIPWYATITVYNESDYVVTNIKVLYVLDWPSREWPTLSRLERGEKFSFELTGSVFSGWQSKGGEIIYYINGRKFGIENEADVRIDCFGNYYSPHELLIGSHAHIFIRNEGHRIVVENGVFFERPCLCQGPPPPPLPD